MLILMFHFGIPPELMDLVSLADALFQSSNMMERVDGYVCFNSERHSYPPCGLQG